MSVEGNSRYPNENYSDQPPPMAGQIPIKQNPLANYQFSSDELRVLRECNSESFFQRSLPLGTSFGLAAYFGVKNGTLSANVKYGAVPKVVVGVIIGYFLGKVSYQRKCAEKIMQLPNSKLAEVLKHKKNISSDGEMVDAALTPAFGLAPFASATRDDIYDDVSLHAEKSNSLDLDFGSNRPSGVELDDTQHTSDTLPELPIEPTKKTVTYEELRKSNREGYQKSHESIFSRPIGSEGTHVIRSTSRRTAQGNNDDDENISSIPTSRNKYGDSWA